MGHYARLLWDIQKTRIMMGNRAAAMERDGIDPLYRAIAQDAADALDAQERALNNHLRRLAKRHPLADWIIDTPGIGLPGFARLLGITGPLDSFATVSKLWKFLGLAVIDGRAPIRKRGIPFTHTNCRAPDHPQCVGVTLGTAYSPQGRVLCHQLGESIVRLNRGPYRAAYDRKKAQYETERPDWTQAHRHNAAMRYSVKCLVRDMWIAWRHTEKAA